MARRRAEMPRADPAPIPVELQSMRGVDTFFDPREPVPDWVMPGEVEAHRRWSAWRRWSDARRQWAAEQGVDYVATFHPRWLRCQLPLACR